MELLAVLLLQLVAALVPARAQDIAERALVLAHLPFVA